MEVKLQIVTGIILLWWAIEDMRYKSIQAGHLLYGIGMLLSIGLVRSLLTGRFGIPGPGIFLLVIACSKKRPIGVADGVIYVVLGLLYGFFGSTAILFYSLMLFGPLALVLLLARWAGREERLPFLPFTLGGFLLWTGGIG